PPCRDLDRLPGEQSSTPAGGGKNRGEKGRGKTWGKRWGIRWGFVPTRGVAAQCMTWVVQTSRLNSPSRSASGTHPYSHAIASATFFGLVQGDTAPDGSPLNRFRPDEPINRAEVSKIIALAREVLGDGK